MAIESRNAQFKGARLSQRRKGSREDRHVRDLRIVFFLTRVCVGEV